MPPVLNYPGVYIEELPSGVQTITGVATSITAFVGWAPQGSTTEAVSVLSWMDYQREFGGLDSRSYLGYAVNHFFNNGGQQAYVVRLVSGAITTGTATGTAGAVTLNVSGVQLTFTAKEVGAWSNGYGIQISPGSGGSGDFNVAIVYAPSGSGLVTVESHNNLTIATVDSMTSAYVTVASSASLTAPPANGTYMLSGGSDGNGVHAPGAASSSVTVFAPNSTTAGFTFTAQNPGAWGNLLAISATPQAGDPTNTRFSLNVLQVNPDGSVTVVENYNNLSVTTTDPMYVVPVLNTDSGYISVAAVGTPSQALNQAAPAPTISQTTAPLGGAILTGGYDGVVLDPTADGASGGLFMTALDAGVSGSTGVHLLDRVDIFNLLCVPGESESATISSLQAYCNSKRAFYIVDPPQSVGLSPTTVQNLAQSGPAGNDSGNLTGANSMNSAYYFPWVQAPDPLLNGRQRLFPPCGFVAGLYAATDANRGVWKAPAGIDAGLTGESGLQYVLTDAENGALNVLAVNCLRHFNVYGDVVWGARTLQGNDQAGSQWKYVPIRRLALYLESSLYIGTQWVVFEPNDETLWGQIRLNVGTFMQGLFLQGAFQGTTPQQAYFVKCDSENNPQSSIDMGVVNILVGFAPLYPAEFVVIQIQQMAGQLQS
jgi:phage tail sheath protein FI